MRLFFYFILSLFPLPIQLLAQNFPAENDTLNYTIIGFRFQEIKKEKEYKIEIASGNINDEASFNKNIIKTDFCKDNRIILQVPAFGKQYTWRVTPQSQSSGSGASVFHHFFTGWFPDADTSVIRLKTEHNADNYKDAYIIMDGNRTMYDMEGHPVWYLPTLGGTIKANSQVRDVKLSCKGTITFLIDGRAFETDYNGRILWEGPNGRKRTGDSLEGYHHELIRLSNGHIMVLGFDPIAKPKPLITDSNGRRIVSDSLQRRTNRAIARQQFGTIIEYDKDNNLVWEWRAANYFKHVDMDFYKKSNGMPEFDIHENSFYFDEKNKAIYVSFRNIGQVLKIKYPSGEVEAAYGKLESATDSMENHMFCAQHSCHLSAKGYLYVFDNGCGLGAIPKVVMMKLPTTENDTIKKIWEFACPVVPAHLEDRPTINSVAMNRRYMFTAGGNVMELPDYSLFVSSNTPYSKLFIVNMDKQLLWSADLEKWHADKNDWEPYSQYRASIIPSRSLLENLIWKSSGE